MARKDRSQLQGPSRPGEAGRGATSHRREGQLLSWEATRKGSICRGRLSPGDRCQTHLAGTPLNQSLSSPLVDRVGGEKQPCPQVTVMRTRASWGWRAKLSSARPGGRPGSLYGGLRTWAEGWVYPERSRFSLWPSKGAGGKGLGRSVPSQGAEGLPNSSLF